MAHSAAAMGVARAAVDGSDGRATGEEPPEGDPLGLRHVFFGDEETTWDLDRILRWLGGLAETRAARLTGGRDPDRSVPLPDAGSGRRTLLAADLDGDGRDELLAVTAGEILLLGR